MQPVPPQPPPSPALPPLPLASLALPSLSLASPALPSPPPPGASWCDALFPSAAQPPAGGTPNAAPVASSASPVAMLASTPLVGVPPLPGGMAHVCWSPSPGNTAAELPSGLSLPPCWDEVDGGPLDGPLPQLTALWLADAADAADAAMAAVEGATGRVDADGGVAWGGGDPLPRPASPSPSSASSSPSARLCKGGSAGTAAVGTLAEGGGRGPKDASGRRSSVDDASDTGDAGGGRPSSSGTAPVTASASAEAMPMGTPTAEALPPPPSQWRTFFDPPAGADADAAATAAARLAAEVSPLWLSQSPPPPGAAAAGHRPLVKSDRPTVGSSHARRAQRWW